MNENTGGDNDDDEYDAVDGADGYRDEKRND